jgi:hypothetical protein
VIGGVSSEKDISAQKKAEKEGTRVPQENAKHKWKKDFKKAQDKGEKKTYSIIQTA